MLIRFVIKSKYGAYLKMKDFQPQWLSTGDAADKYASRYSAKKFVKHMVASGVTFPETLTYERWNEHGAT